MKKILIFSLAYYPQVGGAEVAIKEITDRTGDIEFHMITTRFGASEAQERVGKVLVHRIGDGGYFSKILFAPRAALLAKRLHREEKFDALWAMMSYMLFPVVLLKLFGVRLPYALTLQEGDTYGHMFGRLRVLPFLPLLYIGFRGATVMQAISDYLGAWARKKGFTGPLEIIPNGVDAKQFSSAEPAQVERRNGDVLLVTASRLVHKNAVDDILCALVLCPPNVKLLVAGSGPEEEALRALATKLNVASRVRWLGHLGHDKLPHVLRACDIFVRPSRSEGMGNSFIEAMAAGLPVIATQEGGIVDFLFDAKRNPGKKATGFAVNKDSPIQIAETVEKIVRNPEAAKTVIENARTLVFEKYDWDLIAKNMREKVFGKVL